jgi:hypothetical protein
MPMLFYAADIAIIACCLRRCRCFIYCSHADYLRQTPPPAAAAWLHYFTLFDHFLHADIAAIAAAIDIFTLSLMIFFIDDILMLTRA